MTGPDAFDRLLTPAPSESTPGLRDRLREETTRRLRRHRLGRRLRLAAALAACYLAGGATLWLTRPRPEPVVVLVERPADAPKPPEFAPPALPLSPRELELAAEQADGAESARLYLEAGRRYGGTFNDWTSALRCYRNALDLSDAIPAIDPTKDDWLLANLKTERRQNRENP